MQPGQERQERAQPRHRAARPPRAKEDRPQGERQPHGAQHLRIELEEVEEEGRREGEAGGQRSGQAGTAGGVASEEEQRRDERGRQCVPQKQSDAEPSPGAAPQVQRPVDS